jgi:ribulose-phosphate 3-epimerase
MMPSQREFVEKVTAMGIDVGLAIDLNSPVEAIDKSILTDLDVVLVMSVEAGFGGQKFDPGCIDKIAELASIKRQDATPFKICVDGGETLDTIDDVVKAGADEVVVGRRLFEGNIRENINRFMESAHNEEDN